MKVKPIRRKKTTNAKFKIQYRLPKSQKENSLTGWFNGFSVVVENQKHIQEIYNNGFFGKGCFSRSLCTSKVENEPSIIRKRQFQQRKQWVETHELNRFKEEDVIVLQDSDSEDDKFFNNLQPDVAKALNIPEYLHLGLEEAYFLMSSVKCLDIFDGNKKLDEDEAWQLFCETQENFIQNYITYYYFRTRNWVIKCGLIFGSDFLLYHKSPQKFHASYEVIVDVLQSDTMERNTDICKQNMTWTFLTGLNRLTHTVGKDLVICQVIWPKDVSIDVIKATCNMKLFSVNAVIMRRWVASQERVQN